MCVGGWVGVCVGGWVCVCVCVCGSTTCSDNIQDKLYMGSTAVRLNVIMLDFK